MTRTLCLTTALVWGLATPLLAHSVPATDAATIEEQTAASSAPGILVPLLTFFLIAAVLMDGGGGGGALVELPPT
jgi:hypothetical protein